MYSEGDVNVSGEWCQCINEWCQSIITLFFMKESLDSCSFFLRVDVDVIQVQINSFLVIILSYVHFLRIYVRFLSSFLRIFLFLILFS
jgi:hypothetical protein